MRSSLLLALVLVTAALAVPAHATTWHVPSECPTIQAGVDSAAIGDTVLVACGTYYEHDITMKSGITLRSETGNADCVTIDAQQAGRVILCVNASSQTRIEGLTITGGLFAGTGFGGGLYCSGASPTLTNVTFSHNQAGWGGGMASGSYSSPVLTDVTFSYNQASFDGGGMYCDASSPTLTNVTFSDNEAWCAGGGIYCIGAATLTGCTFSYNQASFDGGGMYCWFGYPEVVLANCTFSGNSADRGGGVSCVYNTNATLVSCTLAGNSAMHGGGIRLQTPDPECPSYATLTNCIIAFSTSGQAISCYESGATLMCSDLYGNGGGDWVGYIADQYGINGNLSEDPLFCGGHDPEERYALHSNSPCAPENSPECGLIGAWGVGCPSTAVEEVSWGVIKAMFR